MGVGDGSFASQEQVLAAAGRVLALAGVLLAASVAQAADGAATSPALFGIPVDFILFAATLLGVALFHHYVLQVALTGLVTITAYKVMFTGFKTGAGIAGFGAHMAHEWVLLANLLGLLVGFALLARHFEDSGVPEVLPKLLPEGWLGPFMLLVIIFVLSGFLDNIAAALIGATVAASVFKRKVHIGYLAAIVAASNGGGAGSVVGDTTTTMMWLDGVSPLDVVEAYIPAAWRWWCSAFRRRCCSTSTWPSAAISRPRTTSTGRGSASSFSSWSAPSSPTSR
jgi:hypothetical protein